MSLRTISAHQNQITVSYLLENIEKIAGLKYTISLWFNLNFPLAYNCHTAVNTLARHVAM